MLKIEFTEADIEKIAHWKEQHPHHRVRKKMAVLYLKSQNLSHKDIKRLERISENTLLSYLLEYQKPEGLEAMLQTHFRITQSEMAAHTEQLLAYFQDHPPATCKEAAAHIEKLTGIKRGENSVRIFLKKLGLKRRKTAAIPAKANVEAQKKFLEEELQPRLQEAEKGKRVVFFVDVAHFVLAPFLGYLWSIVRMFIKAPPGRQRFNVLGALNALTLELITVTNDTYINASSLCELLCIISLLQLDVPVTLVLDNAKYQRCKAVTAHAQTLGIELLFLPPYSPNLNLIERLWKLVKKKCLYSRYYESFPVFKTAIRDCLNRLASDYKVELKSLITFNFQSFEKIHVSAR